MLIRLATLPKAAHDWDADWQELQTVLGRVAGEDAGAGQRVSIGSSSLEPIHVYGLAHVRDERPGF